ncbi:MAG: tol-pal system protein YbgF [Gammaproteobacteria bacterium]
MKRLLFVALTAAAVVSAPALAVSKKELAAQIAQVNERVVSLERLLKNEVLLEMLDRLEALQEEVEELRGEMERTNHELAGVKKRQRELYLDIDKRLQASGGGGVTSAVEGGNVESQFSVGTTSGPAAQQSQQQVATATAGADGTQEREEYRRAFNMLKDGRYSSAITVFDRFLNKYPNSRYAGNAQYWLAESNYVSRKYDQAAKEFNKVISGFPSSPKVPDATLKLGFTYYELSQWDRARKVLSTLRKRYPNSTVARLADKRLKRMKQEGH